ncbi:protein DEK [Dendrobium catenatum]|uniref:Omega-hydroxypalmitate O-feruloyl transferase n=1 Tax=Dendrobium catenatum TaxID=906689 RepID=A0A2I0WNI8_9ASPA|nr:protein DEK [Dendrobium catenatum]PKU77213.1 omega-hydroxypalmitate O-feruloyl transferase [Dendrobium catenatum]
MASQLLVEEASDERPPNGSSADELEVEAAEESTPGGDQVSPKTKGRKRRMEEREGQGEEDKKGRASSLDRPSRERKTVERYAALSPIRSSASKALDIHQGSGEKLKDIPNVAFKLSKRKADDSLRVLHNILFGRKATVHFLKRNILQFSGFVWSQNEEKDKLKVKEKLNKCNKDRLLDLSDLLDVYTLRVHSKKEDISAKLMEFLESPHVTREVMLSEKVKKGKKRKRAVKRTGKRTLDEALIDKEKKREKRSKEPAKDEQEDEGKVDSIDRDNESADEDESTDGEETSENTNSAEEDVEDEHSSELAKKHSDVEGVDEHEEFESKQHSPVVRNASLSTSKKGPSSSKKKLDKESKSNVSLESKIDNSKDTNGSSNMSKTSRKDLSSSKKKVDKEGKPKVPSESKSTISKETKESSNMRKNSKKVLSPSRKKVDSEGEPKVPQESKAVSSKDTKESSKMKIKAPIKTDSKDSSKRNVSVKGDISKKADKKKGKSNIGTPSKDTTVNMKEVANTESNNAEKKRGKQSDLSVVPSTEQLSAVVGKILKEVDFNVATLADIIKQLGAHFDTDLMDRKSEIKHILEEVINNMIDAEDVEDDHGDGDGDDEDAENDHGDGHHEDAEDDNGDGDDDGDDEGEKN